MFMLNQDLTELEQNSVEQELNIPPPHKTSNCSAISFFPLISKCHQEQKMKGFLDLLEF